MRLAVRNAIRSSDEVALRHVAPWLWDAAKTDGRAKTDAGRDIGYELRLSWGRTTV